MYLLALMLWTNQPDLSGLHVQPNWTYPTTYSLVLVKNDPKVYNFEWTVYDDRETYALIGVMYHRGCGIYQCYWRDHKWHVVKFQAQYILIGRTLVPLNVEHRNVVLDIRRSK